MIDSDNLKVRCCYLMANSKIQSEKYKLLNKGISINDPNIYIY
jgi:hypothetical protein